MDSQNTSNNSEYLVTEQDYLTGLANRKALYDYHASLDKNIIIHAMFIDIDNFKRVNDIYGHSMGDKLLICVSQLIQKHARGFTARIGGDEFVVIIDGSIPDSDVNEIAKTLLANIQTIDFRKDILSLISLSIGIVLEQPVSQNLDDVLAKCDAAMYQAKYDGKNRYTVYKSYDKILEINRNIEMEMEDALIDGEFVVYLQPKVNMVTSELFGAEALSRWAHPKDGVRSPHAYIPLFEKTGFISKLDMFIYEETCRIKAGWKGEKYEHIPISVNMSRLHLYNENFPNELLALANKYEIPPNELEFEITEITFLKDSSELIKTVDKLRNIGFMVSIDDFGSGFSALNMLKDLEVDTIKIDKEFLSVSANTSRGKKVIRNVISMCRDLKMDVVTEGIETKEQIEFITRCGCQIGQGFYYAAPLSQEQFENFAEEYLSNIVDNFCFRFNGNLKSEDGSKEGFYNGQNLQFGQGIFKDSKSLVLPGGSCGANIVEIPPECIVNDSYTISLWLRPQKSARWVAANYIKFETGFCGLVPYAWEGQSTFRIRDSKEVNGWYDVTGMRISDDGWWHFCATYNARTETAVAFINGEVVNILKNVPTNRFVKRIMIGGDVFQPSMIGNICELTFFNEAKDYEAIAKMHQEYVTREDFIAFEIDDDIYTIDTSGKIY